jgi:hypothetical protein
MGSEGGEIALYGALVVDTVSVHLSKPMERTTGEILDAPYRACVSIG